MIMGISGDNVCENGFLRYSICDFKLWLHIVTAGGEAHILIHLVQHGTWWQYFCILFPDTFNAQASRHVPEPLHRTETGRKKHLQSSAVSNTHLPHAMLFNSLPIRVSVASPLLSSSCSLSTLFLLPSSMSIFSKTEQPKLSDKSLYINMFKSSVCAREIERQSQRNEGGGGEEQGTRSKRMTPFPIRELSGFSVLADALTEKQCRNLFPAPAVAAD